MIWKKIISDKHYPIDNALYTLKSAKEDFTEEAWNEIAEELRKLLDG